MPHLIHENSSITSEESSVWGGDDRDQYNLELCNNDLKVLEQLSQVANKGNPKAEVQLRYEF